MKRVNHGNVGQVDRPNAFQRRNASRTNCNPLLELPEGRGGIRELGKRARKLQQKFHRGALEMIGSYEDIGCSLGAPFGLQLKRECSSLPNRAFQITKLQNEQSVHLSILVIFADDLSLRLEVDWSSGRPAMGDEFFRRIRKKFVLSSPDSPSATHKLPGITSVSIIRNIFRATNIWKAGRQLRL